MLIFLFYFVNSKKVGNILTNGSTMHTTKQKIYLTKIINFKSCDFWYVYAVERELTMCDDWFFFYFSCLVCGNKKSCETFFFASANLLIFSRRIFFVCTKFTFRTIRLSNFSIISQSNTFSFHNFFITDGHCLWETYHY